jgi:hypothetical protein
MIPRKCLALLILSSFVWFVPGKLNAQSAEKWWTQSSRKDSIKTKLMVHASAKYSYTRMKGSLSGEMHVGDISLVERKGIFTNFTSYGIDKMYLNIKGNTPLVFQSTSHYITDYVDADLSKVVFCQAGFIWERDDLLLIQNRYSLYTGMGLNFELFKKLKMKSLVAAGRINQEYTMPVENVDVVKGPYAAFYCKNNFVFTITPSFSFSGSVFYLTDLNDMKRYRYGTNLTIQASITKHINFVVGYSYKYDNELILFGATPDYITQNLGIEVSL